MTTPADGVRAKRLCDVCFQVDNHPRHVTWVASGGVPTAEELASIATRTDIPAGALVEVMDPSSVVRHFDCCASRGCQTCQVQLDLAGKSKHGEKLLAHIQGNGDKHQEAVEKATGVYELNRSEGEPITSGAANGSVTQEG